MYSRRKFLGTAVGALGVGLGTTGCSADLIRPETRRMAAPVIGSDLRQLSLLAGQTLMTGFVGTSEGDTGTRALAEQLASGEVGAILLLGRNIETAPQVAALTGYLQGSAGSRPVLVAIDNEGGAVTRTAGKPGFSDWMAAERVPGALLSAEAARAYYRQRAAELKSAGINFNLAPVVDVNVNPANPIIGRLGRSFSSDPEAVVRFADAFVQGHRDASVLTCIKHFPGHGSSSSDTHEGITDVSASWAPLELRPYTNLVSTNSVDSIMLSHLLDASFAETPRTPVSLSRAAVDFVRSSLGFSGAIVSDDMQMGAIEAEHSNEEAAVLALAAGNDVVILSNYERPDAELGSQINAAVVRAVVDGRLAPEQLVSAAQRVSGLRSHV